MITQYTPITFYQTFLDGNEMTNFVRYVLKINDHYKSTTDKEMALDIQVQNDGKYEIDSWYKVKDTGCDYDVIKDTLADCGDLIYCTATYGALFIGFPYDGLCYTGGHRFENFVKEFNKRKES